MKDIGIGLAKKLGRIPEGPRRKFSHADPIEQIVAVAVATALALRNHRRHLDVSLRQCVPDDPCCPAESTVDTAAKQLDANQADLQHAPPMPSGQYSTAVRSTGVRKPATAPSSTPRKRGSRPGGVP